VNGLDRKTDPTLRIIGMCEIPSNIFLADEFLSYFDGFSIGSNDLTQLVFGLDRDAKTKGSSGINETHRGVLIPMQIAIDTCVRNGKYIGVCGEGSSNYPELAEFFVEHKASSVSVQHDRILDTIPLIVAAEKKFGLWS
jgi:pyruvate,water dikinase